jgi:hypothetical protein
LHRRKDIAQALQHPGGDGAANFIRQIVSDPKNVPDVALLTGYLGASSEEGHERLYLSPDLTNYVEIPKDAILHQAPLPIEQDARGGVTLWVRKDVALQYKMAPAAQALANYFAGAIQAGAQAAARAPRATPPQTIQDCTLAPALCPVTVIGPACTYANTWDIDCSIVCPTHPPRATCVPNCTHARPCLFTAPTLRGRQLRNCLHGYRPMSGASASRSVRSGLYACNAMPAHGYRGVPNAPASGDLRGWLHA